MDITSRRIYSSIGFNQKNDLVSVFFQVQYSISVLELVRLNLQIMISF